MYVASFLAGDKAYDLAYMDVASVPEFAARGWVIPLDDRFSREARAEFLPGDVAGSVFQGRPYGVPMESDAGVLFYRKDLLEKAGIRPPETFHDLEAACRTLQDPPGLWGYVFQGMAGEGLVCNFLEILWGYGGAMMDGNEVTIDSPQAVEALSWMVGLVRSERICPRDVTTYREEESCRVFQEGRAVFMRNHSYAWNEVQKEGSPVGGRVGICPVVHTKSRDGAAALGGWCLGITKTCANKDAAWAFVRFATGANMQKLFHERTGAIPARRSLFRDPGIVAKNPHYPELYEILLTARPRPLHPAYREISKVIRRYVSDALAGRTSPEEATRAMAEEIRATGRR
jgi:multiple sugar transport system substrate-binding protein